MLPADARTFQVVLAAGETPAIGPGALPCLAEAIDAQRCFDQPNAVDRLTTVSLSPWKTIVGMLLGTLPLPAAAPRIAASLEDRSVPARGRQSRVHADGGIHVGKEIALHGRHGATCGQVRDVDALGVDPEFARHLLADRA
jgi:hypothetical protein